MVLCNCLFVYYIFFKNINNENTETFFSHLFLCKSIKAFLFHTFASLQKHKRIWCFISEEIDAIAGGAGGEKLSEFHTFLLFICSGKGKKEKIYFEKYIKKWTDRWSQFWQCQNWESAFLTAPPFLTIWMFDDLTMTTIKWGHLDFPGPVCCICMYVLQTSLWQGSCRLRALVWGRKPGGFRAPLKTFSGCSNPISPLHATLLMPP